MSAPSRNHKRRLRSPYLLPLFRAGLTVAKWIPSLRRFPVASSRRLLGRRLLALRLARGLWGRLFGLAGAGLACLHLLDGGLPRGGLLALLHRRCFDARNGSTRLLDRGTRALGDQHAVQLDGLLELAVQDDLRLLRGGRHDARGLQRQQIDLVHGHAREVRQPDFGGVLARPRHEAALGQAALQRHLAAFEADLVEAARARMLALVTASRGLAEAGPDAA